LEEHPTVYVADKYEKLFVAGETDGIARYQRAAARPSSIRWKLAASFDPVVSALPSL
jgi:hypothetical protein